MAETPYRIAVQKAVRSISLVLCEELLEICDHELQKKERETWIPDRRNKKNLGASATIIRELHVNDPQKKLVTCLNLFYMESVSSGEKDEPLLKTLPFDCVKPQWSEDLGSVRVAVKDDYMKDFVPDMDVKQEWSQEMESVSGAEKDEPVINTLPFECVNVKCLQNLGSLSDAVKDKLLTDFVPNLHVKQEWSQDMECMAVKQESPPEISPDFSVKQETQEDLEEPDGEYPFFSLKMESTDEVAIEDCDISLRDGSDRVQSRSSDEDKSDTETYITDKLSSQSSLFSTRKAGYYSLKSSFIEDASEGICKSNKDTASQQSIEEHASLSALNTYNECETNYILPDNGNVSITKGFLKCEICGKLFPERHQLTYHLLIHSGETENIMNNDNVIVIHKIELVNEAPNDEDSQRGIMELGNEAQSQVEATPSIGTSVLKRRKLSTAECRRNISTLSSSRITLCEREIEVLNKKYEKELEVLELKKQNQLLKQEILKYKLALIKERGEDFSLK